MKVSAIPVATRMNIMKALSKLSPLLTDKGLANCLWSLNCMGFTFSILNNAKSVYVNNGQNDDMSDNKQQIINEQQ